MICSRDSCSFRNNLFNVSNHLKGEQCEIKLISPPGEYIDASTANLLTLIKYVNFRAVLKRVCDDFVGRGHYTRNYTSALIIP